MVISRFSTLSLLHMNMKLTTEFKVVYLQGHPYKISMRTLIKTTAVTIIGTRYYNGFGDPPSLDGYCYNLWHVYTDLWSRPRRLIRQRYAKVFSVPPIRDEGSSCRPKSNPTSKSAAVFVFSFSVTLVVWDNNQDMHTPGIFSFRRESTFILLHYSLTKRNKRHGQKMKHWNSKIEHILRYCLICTKKAWNTTPLDVSYLWRPLGCSLFHNIK